jgi:dTDP-L-rhamnose 4-epimerase
MSDCIRSGIWSPFSVVDAAILALDRSEANGQVINIGNEPPRRIRDRAGTLAHLLGRQDLQPRISDQFRKGDIRHCTADIGKAYGLLGFQSKVRWDEGLAELKGWANSAPSTDGFGQPESELR